MMSRVAKVDSLVNFCYIARCDINLSSNFFCDFPIYSFLMDLESLIWTGLNLPEK